MSRNIASGANAIQAKGFVITAEQRDAILAYLMDRPFREVANAVMWLQQLPPVPLPRAEGADGPPGPTPE